MAPNFFGIWRPTFVFLVEKKVGRVDFGRFCPKRGLGVLAILAILAVFCASGVEFRRFWVPKRLPGGYFFGVFLKTVILSKSCSRLGEIAIFHVSSLRKTIKNRCQHRPRKKHRKKPSKIDFPLQVGLPKFPKIHPSIDLSIY